MAQGCFWRQSGALGCTAELYLVSEVPEIGMCCSLCFCNCRPAAATMLCDSADASATFAARAQVHGGSLAAGLMQVVMTRRQARSMVGNLGARGTGSSDGSIIISAVPGNDWRVSSSIPDGPYQPTRRVSHTGVILHDTTEKVGSGQIASGICLGGNRPARCPVRQAAAASQT